MPRRDNKYALAIGIGMALFPIHNTWLAKISEVNGEAVLFLPVFGAVIWILATLFYLRDNYKELQWGSRAVYIPLFIIVGAIALSGITAKSLYDGLSPLFMGCCLLSLYLVSRQLGGDIFLPLAIGSGIASLGVILHGFIYKGDVTGGFIFEGNYDVVVGYVLLGLALYIKKYQWVLASLSLVAMYLTGSPEAVFAIGVLSLVVIIRKDWGKRLVIAVTPVIIVIILWFSLGYGQLLYSYTKSVFYNQDTVSAYNVGRIGAGAKSIEQESALSYRIMVVKHNLENIQPFGYGYNLTDFNKMPNVHNVPLILIQQLGYTGILAGLAWLWVSMYCLIKTKWRYVWVTVLALSVFDHYIWTQLALYWWVIIGVSTTSKIESDLVFR